MSVRWQITGLWLERSRVSISTLSEAAALVYLSSACNYKWSQFDGWSHAPHRNISYPSHNAVIDVLESVERFGDDSTVPISSKHSDTLTEFLSLCGLHQYLTPPTTNQMWGTSYTIVHFPALLAALILNTHFIFSTVRKVQFRTQTQIHFYQWILRF